MAAADPESQSEAQSGQEAGAEGEAKEAGKEVPDKKVEGAMCLVNGKRHLLCQDYEAAVEALGLACELLTAEHGEKAPECAEAYLYYGKALLELARLEAGVLGNIDPENAESEDDEDEEEEEDDKEDSPETKDSADGEAGESEPEKKVGESEAEMVEGEKQEGEDAAAQQAEDEEDPSNLQLAWEMLELAKTVYTEQLEGKVGPEAVKVELKLFETFLTLGEVSLENENYTQAVEDLSICLEKQKAALPADSRAIAVTHYQLGVALGFHMKYEEAVASLQAAIAVLNTRIANLASKTESVDTEKASDAFYSREKEIKEIEALIPEIKEKIADTEEMREEASRKVAEMKEQMGFGSSSSFPKSGDSSSSFSGASGSGAKPVSSISIKRKADSDSNGDVKKVKTTTEIVKESNEASSSKL